MFDPAGAEAVRVLEMFWIFLAGAAVIWTLVMIGTWIAVRRAPRPGSARAGRRLIYFGGIVAPTVVLAAVALLGLDAMVELRGQPAERTVRVTGEQFWWRVEYLDDDGAVVVETANEIALPRGSGAALELTTGDVIHSFWVPALAGKVDMIPGRSNALVLEPMRAGTFRGQCAEFCGTSHALMAFTVRVMGPGEFARWLAAQRRPARPPQDAAARRGHGLFLGYGCGACHRVRGTPADGRLGPDLTHFASRARFAAGTLANERAALLAWLRHPERIKPDVRMPAFAMLPDAELAALAVYLGSLE